MPHLDGINRITSRIETIKSRFKSGDFKPEALRGSGSIPFDATLKQAMGAQNTNSMQSMGGPDSLMALLNSPQFQNQYGGPNTRNQNIADVGKSWDGKDFKPGQTERCADFVSTVIKDSGAAPAGFKHEVNCLRLQEYGKKVEKSDLKPGDIVYFGNTYMPGDYTHVGIYIGDNKFVHRPTAAKPVRVDELSGYYGDKYCGARRLNG